MAIWSRKSLLQSAVDDWAERNLIDTKTKDILSEDIGAPHRGLSFNGFLLLAGVICLAFGAMSFVAANWDELPRLTRAALIFGAMWAAWAGAAWALWRQHPWVFECFALLASALFGAAIMLIAQLYHIQGPPEGAVLLWLIGALIAAALVRSGLGLALVFILLATWHVMVIDNSWGGENTAFLIWWGLATLVAWWVRSRAAAHLSALSLGFWCLTAMMVHDLTPLVLALAGAGATTAIVLVLLSAGSIRVLRGFERQVITYLILFFGLTVLIALGLADDFRRGPYMAGPWMLAFSLAPLAFAVVAWRLKIDTAYDAWIAAAVCAGFVFAFSVFPHPWTQSATAVAIFVWIPRLGWRLENRPIRLLGMIGFAVALLIVYAVTVGTLIGTSGFYLGAGVVLIAGAWIGGRLGRGTTEAGA